MFLIKTYISQTFFSVQISSGTAVKSDYKKLRLFQQTLILCEHFDFKSNVSDNENFFKDVLIILFFIF